MQTTALRGKSSSSRHKCRFDRVYPWRIIEIAGRRVIFCARMRERERRRKERERERLVFMSCANGEIGFLITRATPVHQIHLHASSPHAIQGAIVQHDGRSPEYRMTECKRILTEEILPKIFRPVYFDIYISVYVKDFVLKSRARSLFFRGKRKLRARGKIIESN